MIWQRLILNNEIHLMTHGMYVCVCMLGDKRSELLLHELLLVVVDKLRNINQHHEHHIQSSSILT